MNEKAKKDKKATVKDMTKNMTLSAMFLALGLVLPLLTGQIPQIGNMLLPMHLPVFLCGLICGWQYGGVIGFITPLLRYVIFGMPVLYPTGLAMSLELMTYGIVAGLLYAISKWQCVVALYRCLIAAMVAGRVVWGIAEVVLLGLSGDSFTWQAFFAGAFLNAIPGIILQLILIPGIMLALHLTVLVPFKRHDPSRHKSHV